MLRHMYLCILLTLPSLLPCNSLAATRLTIGTSSHYPPFVMQSANKVIYGFDVELMLDICSRIDAICNFRAMSFDELEQALESNQVDAAIAAITITPSRLKTLPFSISYSPSQAKWLSRSDYIASAKDKGSPAPRLGVQKGTLFEQFIDENITNKTKVLHYRTTDELLNALNAKKVDSILLDEPTAVYWANSSNGLFKTQGKSIAIGLGLGIAVSKKSAAFLLPLINQAILNMKKDGKLKSLSQNYFPKTNGLPLR